MAAAINRHIGVSPIGFRHPRPLVAWIRFTCNVCRQFIENGFEVFRFPEVPVDGGKPDISNVVQRLQAVHDQKTDFLRWNIRLAAALQLADDSGHHTLHPIRLNGPFAKRDLDGPGHLVPVERDAFSRPL